MLTNIGRCMAFLTLQTSSIYELIGEWNTCDEPGGQGLLIICTCWKGPTGPEPNIYKGGSGVLRGGPEVSEVPHPGIPSIPLGTLPECN